LIAKDGLSMHPRVFNIDIPPIMHVSKLEIMRVEEEMGKLKNKKGSI